MERAPVDPRRDLRVRLGRLLQGQVFGQRDDALQERVEPLEPGQVELGQLGGSHLPRPHQRRQLRDRQEGQAFVRVRPLGCVPLRSDRLVPPDPFRLPQPRARHERQRRRHLVPHRHLPELVERLQVAADGPRRLLPLLVRQLQAGDPLRLPDHLRRHLVRLCRLRRDRPAERLRADPQDGQAFQDRPPFQGSRLRVGRSSVSRRVIQLVEVEVHGCPVASLGRSGRGSGMIAGRSGNLKDLISVQGGSIRLASRAGCVEIEGFTAIDACGRQSNSRCSPGPRWTG